MPSALYSLSLSSLQTSFSLTQLLTVLKYYSYNFHQTRQDPIFSGPKFEILGKGWDWGPRLGVGTKDVAAPTGLE